MRARWAARRAAASETGSDGGAWLDGDAAGAAACDASMTPVVTGDIDPGVLEELVRLCAHLDRLRRDGTPGARPDAPGTPANPGPSLREVLEQQVIGAAIALVSGPGGLAGFLRRRQLGTRLAGRSLPLDVGVSTDIPAAIRRAVIERDQHCRFPNGCDQPAAGCEVHHLTHKADGGKTSRPGLHPVLHLPPPGRDPPQRLDRRPEPRRHHHRLEQGQDQDPPQPQPTTARPPGPGEPPGPEGPGAVRPPGPRAPGRRDH